MRFDLDRVSGDSITMWQSTKLIWLVRNKLGVAANNGKVSLTNGSKSYHIVYMLMQLET